jgi:hypothetical protein
MRMVLMGVKDNVFISYRSILQHIIWMFTYVLHALSNIQLIYHIRWFRSFKVLHAIELNSQIDC